MERKDHPVWALYDALRTASWKVEYFTERLVATKKKNRDLEILIAVVVPTSAVASLPLWNMSEYLKGVWLFFVVVGGICAVVKPFLRLTDAIQAYEGTIARFKSVEADLLALRAEVQSKGRYGPATREKFSLVNTALQRARAGEAPEVANSKLAEKIYDNVNRQFPTSAFFVPED